jgi:hypothetical protein
MEETHWSCLQVEVWITSRNDEGVQLAAYPPGSIRLADLSLSQEHEAWDVVLACQGQLRLAPSGHVIGIDMTAALKIGAARGCDPEVPLGAAASCGGGFGGGVVPRPRPRIIAPTLTTGAYRTRRIAAGHR